MFVSFEPSLLLLWIFITSLIPGAILSVSLFKKQDYLTLVEKVFIGFALGLIILPLIPFLFYFIAGIKYSFDIAVLSTILLYGVAIGFFVKNKMHEGLKLPNNFDIKLTKNNIISASMILLVLIAFIIRVVSYSPVFHELDPYYYAYSPYQLLLFGENPQDDQTAWYPELITSHRIVPALSYLEAIWYSFYTMGGEVDNMLLAVITSIYPPIMGALAFFFLYLFIASACKREWAVVGAAIASFAPVLITKMFAGEQEVQPYAFFAIAFFLAMYALMIKMKDMKFAVIAGIAFAAISLGSSSQILAIAFVMLFAGLYSVALFLREKDNNELKTFIMNNGIVFVLGPLLGTGLKSMFYSPEYSFYLGIAIPFAMVLVFAGVLYYIRETVKSYSSSVLIFLGISVLGMLLIFFTPLGDSVKQVGESGFGIATYNSALDRTIAEQGATAGILASQMGFIASSYPPVIDMIFAIPSMIMNALFDLSVKSLNSLLGTDVVYNEKSNSFILLWILLFFIALAYSLYKFIVKKENNAIVLLFAAVVVPPLIVGVIKAKYTIYATFFIAAAIAFVLGESEDGLSKLLASKEGQESMKEQIYYAIIGIGVLLVAFQFIHNGLATNLLVSSLQPRFQDNPIALQDKFSSFCTEYGDPDVCAAADDPKGYAEKGTNYQYSSKLCSLSQVADPANPTPQEQLAVSVRCQRLTNYWIESMEWIRDNAEDDARITSWWDYGHWINYFGLTDTVLRNEHRSHEMIQEVAHAYIDGSSEELLELMDKYDSKYALFDKELVFGGSQLGGKYGALNYLSCNRNNETNISFGPGESSCELDHLWEVIFVPSEPSGRTCVISPNTGKVGITAYKLNMLRPGGPVPLQFYPGYCLKENINNDQNNLVACQNYILLEPTYCIGNTTLANGEQVYATYYIDQTYPNGDLKINKGFLSLPGNVGDTYHLDNTIMFTLIYTKDEVWFENGEVVSGYEDRKGKFYDSNLYKALFMDEIPGFEKVYQTNDDMVKIYKIKE